MDVELCARWLRACRPDSLNPFRRRGKRRASVTMWVPSRSCWAYAIRGAIKEQKGREGETGPRMVQEPLWIMYMDYAFHQMPCAGPLLSAHSSRPASLRSRPPFEYRAWLVWGGV